MPTPASTTAAGIARRFGEDQFRGIETDIGEVNTTMVSLLPLRRRASSLKVATIDGGATDVEVYGRTKQKAAHAYTGALTLRSHIGFWAEAGIPLGAELMGGTEEPRANVMDILDRSIAALPAGVEKVQYRWDAGYFAADLAGACVERGVDFAIGVKQTAKVMAAAGLGRYSWVAAVGMEDTELAVIDYMPVPGPRTRISPALPGGPGSRSTASRPPGPASAARSTKASSPWRWRGASMRSTATRSSSPTWTSPPLRSSPKWSGGTGTAPTLRNSTVTPR